jgi:DegV family protein with EDD domain
MNVKIITDSASDLPKELLEEYEIDIIPIRVYDEMETEFFDGETLMPTDLFQKMREGISFKTSLPSYESIRETFMQYADSQTPCIYISFSSELSGTYQSTVLIMNEIKEEVPTFDCDAIDTKCASLGQGLVVLKAAKLAKEGIGKEELIEKIKNCATQVEHIFTVDDLQYLVRGGRVSKVAGFVGGLLNIKPILNVEDGKLIPLEKIRGSKKVFKRMSEIMEERGVDLKNQLIGISHGDDLEAALTLKELIKEKFGCEYFVINSIGAAIGAHSGPGTLALFFMNVGEDL